MNYDKLTKNGGIKKSTKKNLKTRVRAGGMKLRSGEQMKRVGGGVVSVPVEYTKKQRKKFQKFIRNLYESKSELDLVIECFVDWFLESHNISNRPDVWDWVQSSLDPRKDEYVYRLWYLFLRGTCFSKNDLFQESLALYEDPEYRKVVTPLKYQSVDLLEVA